MRDTDGVVAGAEQPVPHLYALREHARRAPGELALDVLARAARRESVGALCDARTERGAADAGIGRKLLWRENRIEPRGALASIGIAHVGRGHIAQERPVAERIFQAQAGRTQ